MTFREPYITPSKRLYQQRPLQDGVRPTNINIFTNPIPFSKTDWPRVQGIKPYVSDVAHTDINLYPNPIPFSQLNWFPVTQPQPSRSQAVLNNTVLTVVTVQNPFFVQDFSTSHQIPDWLVSTQYPNLVLQSFSTPFSAQDFSKPFVPVPAKPDQQELNINLFTNPIPFGPFVYPPANPVQGKASDAVQPWQNFYATVVTQAPFAQYIWPIVQPANIPQPQPIPFNANLYTNPIPFALYSWPTTTAVQGHAADVVQPWQNFYTVPFAQYDWSKTQFSPNGYPQNYPNIALLNQVVIASPFYPVDFSRPFVPTPAKVDVQSVNTNLFTNDIPLNQIDWQKPYRIIPIVSDQSNLPNLLLIQPSVPSNPLGIYSWLDLYKYVTLYPTTPALLQNLTLILPPPAPEPIIIGGSKWIEGVNALLKARQTQATDVTKAAAVLSSMGGHARAESLTSRQRSNIASKAAIARWNPPIKK